MLVDFDVEIFMIGEEMTPSLLDSNLCETKKSAKVRKCLGNGEFHEKAGKKNQLW